MTLRASVRAELLAVSLVCGCAGWHRVDLVSDTTLAPRQQVQVWKDPSPECCTAFVLPRTP